MIIYIGIALFILVGVCCKQADKVYKVSLIGLFLFTGLRNPDLGLTDTIIYQRFFRNVPNLVDIVGYDSVYTWGYTILNSFVKTFSDEFLLYQIVYAAISVGLLYLIVELLELGNKEKCLFLFSYFCYRFIWNTWVILRQNLANLFFWMFLILLYKENDRRKKIGWIMLAIIVPTFFHTSAWVNVILLLVLFIFSKISIDIKNRVIPVFGIIMYLFGEKVYGSVLAFMQNVIDIRYSMYSFEANSSNGINFVFRLVFYLFFMWHYNRNANKRNKFVLDMMEIMFIVGSINAELTTRMYEYYAIGLYAGMASILQMFTKRSRFLILSIYGLGMLIIFARFLLITDDGVLANYSVWLGDKIY